MTKMSAESLLVGQLHAAERDLRLIAEHLQIDGMLDGPLIVRQIQEVVRSAFRAGFEAALASDRLGELDALVEAAWKDYNR